MSRRQLFILGAVVGWFVYRRRWALIHNCIAHPAVGLLGEGGRASNFHDWTAGKWEEVLSEHRHEYKQEDYATGVSYAAVYKCACGESYVETSRGRIFYDRDGNRKPSLNARTLYRERDGESG